MSGYLTTCAPPLVPKSDRAARTAREGACLGGARILPFSLGEGVETCPGPQGEPVSPMILITPTLVTALKRRVRGFRTRECGNVVQKSQALAQPKLRSCRRLGEEYTCVKKEQRRRIDPFFPYTSGKRQKL